MPRLFTGLEIPEDVAMSLNLMRGGIFGARWIDPENYHITLRFMGDIPDMVASELAERLTTVKLRPFDIRLKGLGFFGGNQPHTLEEIGQKFDLTRERVRQIKEKAIRRMKHTSRSGVLKAYLG